MGQQDAPRKRRPEISMPGTSHLVQVKAHCNQLSRTRNQVPSQPDDIMSIGDTTRSLQAEIRDPETAEVTDDFSVFGPRTEKSL